MLRKRRIGAVYLLSPVGFLFLTVGLCFANFEIWAQSRCGSGSELSDPSSLKKLLTERPHDTQLYVCLGDAEARSDNPSAAMDSYRKAVAADAGNVGAWRGIARLERIALKDDPSNQDLRLQLIEATLHVNPKTDSGEDISLFLKSGPSQKDELKLTAILIAAGKLDDAQTILTKLTQTEPVPVEVGFQLGLILMEKGDYEAAVMDIGRAVQAEPGESRYTLALSEALLRWHHYSTARALLLAVQKNFGALPQFQYDLAYSEYGMQDIEPAMAILSSLVKEHPEYAPALFLLGDCYALKGDLTRGKQLLLDAIRSDSSKPVYYGSLVEVERHQGDIREALATARKGLALDPDDAKLILESALCHEEVGEYASAQQLLERLVQLQPNDLTAHRILARIYGRTGDAAGAMAERKKLEKLSSTLKSANSSESIP